MSVKSAYRRNGINPLAASINGTPDPDLLIGANPLAALITGTSGPDTLNGTPDPDEIDGGGGDDVINGLGGADIMRGGQGNDTMFVDNVGDTIVELANEGFDVVAAALSWTLTAGAHLELMTTGWIEGPALIDLTGNELDQQIWGNAAANLISGGDGDDTLFGFGGSDTLVGGSGRDVLFGGAGASDTLRGGLGDDTYFADDAGDAIVENAGEGQDVAAASIDYVLGAGASIELMTTGFIGGVATLNLTGNEVGNEIWGNDGINQLNGGGGNVTDALFGFGGNDALNGGAGLDLLVGGGGQDSFVFANALSGAEADIVADFSPADDTILLGGGAGEPFAQLASGTLRAGTFVIGTAALDADDYLIYNSITGALLYDADGNGAGAAVQFAALPTGLVLTGADFLVSGAANTAPAITSGATATVAENSPASTIVYQVLANDADGDRITYSLTGADAGLLSIDANGAVRLLSPPNFETKASYSFTVVASDSGVSTGKAVTLAITDVNETVQTPIIPETSGPNDSTAQAQFIDRTLLLASTNPNLPNDDLPSATIEGIISTAGDGDYFSITLAEGELLILDVDGTAGGLDAFLEVYKPNGISLVGSNDDLVSFDPGSVPTIASHNTDSYFQFRAEFAGTYYFAIKSFEGSSSGSYKLNVSIGPTASAEQILQEDAEALISGFLWNHKNLTYGFPQLASQYPDSFPEANPDSEFQPFSTVQQAATRQLLQLIANVSSLTFAELTGGFDHTSGAGSADLRYAMSTDDSVGAAHAYFPTNGGPTSLGGSSWFNTTSFNNPLKGTYAWMGILHETGHALGLEHGHEDAPVVSSEHDSVEYTVMTYRSYVGDPLVGGYSNEQFGYAQTLMMLDIAALQKIYGANFTTNQSDSVYTWSPTTGEMSINGVGQGAPGTGAGGNQNRILLTIWDGGGNDTYDMSNYSGGLEIDLRPGQWSRTGAQQLANLGDGNFARGNIANAMQYLGDSRSLIENAIGGSSADVLTANKARNSLTGNAGTDLFVWHSVQDIGLGSNADVVTDFARDPEHLDLLNVDAVSGTQSNESFQFIGSNAFSGTAGELRTQVFGNSIHVFGDVNGDAIADFEIIVNNQTILFHNDFIL